ncbi:Uncharacterised protein [Klebsiella pneumoniae]|nr:Uncharacterised protein [Klebsiella pneumoniae]
MFTPPGTVALNSYCSFEMKCIHQALNHFVVQRSSLSSERQCYPPITIAAQVLIIDLFDSAFHFIVFSRGAEYFQMIVKRTPGYLSYLQKLIERIVQPQFVDNSDLIPYRTKAFNFFK